jgi:hypothetical protein
MSLTGTRINVVTAETGAIIKPGPMVTAPPSVVVDDTDFAAFAEGSGLNSPFLADLLAACITHERLGVNLFRTLSALTQNPKLKPEYDRLAGEAEQASLIWGRLIRESGGNEQYVSPPARLTETMDNKVIEALLGSGSADPLSVELAGVKAVLVAATLCVANARTLEQIAEAAEGPAAEKMMEAATELGPMADAHYIWATDNLATMVMVQAKHPVAQKMAQAVETMAGKVKDALH